MSTGMFNRRAKHRFYGFIAVAVSFVLLTILCFIQNYAGKFRQTKDLTANYLNYNGENDISAAHGYLKQPEACLTSDGSQPTMIVILQLKVNNLQNRRVVREKWKIVEEKCLFKIIFLSTGYDAMVPDQDSKISENVKNVLETYTSSESDLLRVGELKNNLKMDKIRTLINLSLPWIKDKCQPPQMIFVGKDVSTKSPVLYLEDLIGQSMIYGEKELTSESDEFSKCAAEALISERRKSLYILNKNQMEKPILDVLNQTDLNFDTEEIRYLLMEPQAKVVNPDTFAFLVHNPKICESEALISRSIFIIVITHSDAKNFKLREKIRSIWGSRRVLQQNHAINFFILGLSSDPNIQKKVEEEQALHQDIVQSSFPESYRSLSFKHRSALKYLSTYCTNLKYKYVLKTDDDMVLDLQSIITYMQQLEMTNSQKISKTIFCAHLVEEDRVPRNESYKWYITPEEYPGRIYPPYCYGNGYLMTSDLIEPLYYMSLYTRNFWVDDAYFSGFIARNLDNVTHAELPFQHPLYSKVYPPEVVLEKKKWLVHTWQDVDVFDAYWYGFESRHDINVRKIFSAGVKHRTGLDLSDTVFEGVSQPTAV